MVDQKTNLGQVLVSTGYDASATSIVLTTGQGALLPDPAGNNYNLSWYDATNNTAPSSDANWEVVRVTAKTGDTLTVTRAQEGTAATTKNTAAAQYVMYNAWTNADATSINASLTSKLENLSEDTTPELGGDLVAADKNITGLGSASFTQELDLGSKTTDFSVDFSTDQKQAATLTANTMTITLDTTSVGVASSLLRIVNGGLATITWATESGTLTFAGGVDPTLTSSGVDIISFYFNGTNWWGVPTSFVA